MEWLVGLGLGVAAIGTWSIWKIPLLVLKGSSLAGAERLEAEDRVRQTVIKAWTALFTVVGLLVSAQQFRLTYEQSVQDSNVDLYFEVSKLICEEEDTTTAAAFHALDLLMQAHPESFYWRAREVLVAHIADEHLVRDAAPDKDEGCRRCAPLAVSCGDPDVPVHHAFAVSILARRLGDAQRAEQTGELGRRMLSLKGCDLRKCLLAETEYLLANFQYADLRCATVLGATFHHAVFNDADLRGANMTRCTFGDETTFVGAQLEALDLRGADLRKLTPDAIVSAARGQQADERRAIELLASTRLCSHTQAPAWYVKPIAACPEGCPGKRPNG